MVRRDYTNQFGYICPTENKAIRQADKPIYKPRQIKQRTTGVLTEADIARMDKGRKDERSCLIDYFNQVEKVEVPEVKAQPDPGLKVARSLKMIFGAVAALQRFKIVDFVLVDKATQKEYKWGDL